jgi:hypothetical protein
MRKRGLAKVKELFWYSDSEPNEVLIAFCHLICLPLALVVEFDNPSIWLVLGGMGAGAFQLWAVVWKGCLRYRLIAVQIATLVAIMTVENLYMEDLLVGSRTGWVIILVFAAWNTIRVFKEKIDRNG